MSTRLPHKEKYTTETEHLAMQSINPANSNGDASPPNEEDSPKCDSDEIEDLESRALALRRKSTFAQRSTISKVLFSLSFCFFNPDILNIKCELYFQASRSGAQIVRRRQNKSSAILVAIIVVFLICHIHRLVFRIYELAHPEKSLYKHYLKCEIFCPFIFTISLFRKNKFAFNEKF